LGEPACLPAIIGKATGRSAEAALLAPFPVKGYNVQGKWAVIGEDLTAGENVEETVSTVCSAATERAEAVM